MSTPSSSQRAPARSASPRARTAVISPFITIEPDYLTFPPPHHGRCIQNVVYFYNTATVPCVYKLRSQNPDRYIAKPHVAVVAPKSATRIRVTLRNLGESSADNIAPAQQDRFRVSVKMLNTPARQKLIEAQNYDAKKVWEAAGSTVEHEKDLMAFFKPGVEAPPNGMVTFLPPHYLPVPARGDSSTGRRSNSRMGSVATAETPRRNLAGEMDREATSPAMANGSPDSATSFAAGANGSSARGAQTAKGSRRRSRIVMVTLFLIALFVLIAAYTVGSQERRVREAVESDSAPLMANDVDVADETEISFDY